MQIPVGLFWLVVILCLVVGILIGTVAVITLALCMAQANEENDEEEEEE